jgi:hypothetical protein
VNWHQLYAEFCLERFSQSIAPRTEKGDAVCELNDFLHVTSMLGAQFLALFIEPQTGDNCPHAAPTNRLCRPSDHSPEYTRSSSHSDCLHVGLNLNKKYLDCSE